MGKGRVVEAEGHATMVSASAHSGPKWWRVLDLDKLPGARRIDGSEDGIRYADRLLGGRREQPWPDEAAAIVSSHASQEEAQFEAERLNRALKEASNVSSNETPKAGNGVEKK